MRKACACKGGGSPRHCRETVTAAPAPATEAPAPAEKKYVIAVLMKTLQGEFVKNIADAILERAKELPEVEVIIQDASEDISKQLAQCESMVAQGVDAIILNAEDAGKV